jgi:hypothetical protein
MLQFLSKDVQLLTIKNIVPMPYKLLSWIDINKLDRGQLAKNPAAIDFLHDRAISPKSIYHADLSKQFYRAISPNPFNRASSPKPYIWYYLSADPTAIELLQKNQDKINWWIFSRNSAIFEPDIEKHNEICMDLLDDIY